MWLELGSMHEVDMALGFTQEVDVAFYIHSYGSLAASRVQLAFLRPHSSAQCMASFRIIQEVVILISQQTDCSLNEAREKTRDCCCSFLNNT